MLVDAFGVVAGLFLGHAEDGGEVAGVSACLDEGVANRVAQAVECDAVAYLAFRAQAADVLEEHGAAPGPITWRAWPGGRAVVLHARVYFNRNDRLGSIWSPLALRGDDEAADRAWADRVFASALTAEGVRPWRRALAYAAARAWGSAWYDRWALPGKITAAARGTAAIPSDL